MVLAIYLQLHQPFRLHPGSDRYIWDERNEERFRTENKGEYLPTIELLTDIIRNYPDFKFALGMSGTFLEQAEKYAPELVKSLQELCSEGADRIELLDETFHNSIADLFSDQRKAEFRSQVSLHRAKLENLFGRSSSTFRGTERRYNNDIARIVADMNFNVMLADVVSGSSSSHHNLYRAKGSNVIVIPRDVRLSHLVSRKFFDSPENYAQKILESSGEITLLGYGLERVGVEKLRQFWRQIPEALTKKGIKVATPSEIAHIYKGTELQELDIPGYSTATFHSVEEAKIATHGFINCHVDLNLLKRIEELEGIAKKVGGDLETDWRHLTAYDHFRAMRRNRDLPISLRNPYENIAQAIYVFTEKVSGLENKLRYSFSIINKPRKKIVLIVGPEIATLSLKMGQQAGYVYSQVGGQALMVSTLIEVLLHFIENGPLDKSWEVRLSTLNLIKRFREQSGLDPQEYMRRNYHERRDLFDLVNFHGSHQFMNAYDGDESARALTAAQFQSHVADYTMKILSQESEANLILHTHDHMAGGYLNAKATARGIPNLHTSHHIFSLAVPMSLFTVVSDDVKEKLILTADGKVDTQPTAMRNAWIWNTPNAQWLDDMVYNHFPDVIPPQQVTEAYAKHQYGKSAAVLNAIPPSLYPENIIYLKKPKEFFPPNVAELVTSFGPVTGEDYSTILEAKKRNLVAWQRLTKAEINENAIMALYNARADKWQKTIHWVYEKAPYLVHYLRNQGIPLQIGILANAAGNCEEEKREIDQELVRIALNSNGAIVYYPYSREFEALGNAAASFGFGPSKFETCGQNDIIAILNGAFFVATNTSGYKAKLKALKLRMDGNIQDEGNAFLHDHNPNSYWFSMVDAVKTMFRLQQHPQEDGRNRNRIMQEARLNWSIEKMGLGYINLYDILFSYKK